MPDAVAYERELDPACVAPYQFCDMPAEWQAGIRIELATQDQSWDVRTRRDDRGGPKLGPAGANAVITDLVQCFRASGRRLAQVWAVATFDCHLGRIVRIRCS